MAEFRIPKQPDRLLVEALGKVRNEVADTIDLYVQVEKHEGGGGCEAKGPNPHTNPALEYIFELNSQVMPRVSLLWSSGGPHMLNIMRRPAEPTDQVTLDHSEWSKVPADTRSLAFVKVLASARKHLHAENVEVIRPGKRDSGFADWERAQQAVVASLEGTLQGLMVEFARRTAEADAAARERHTAIEAGLREEHASRLNIFANEQAKQQAVLAKAREDLDRRLESFKTKEARYLAREQTDKMLTQIEGWIQKWELTEGTRAKRRPVLWAYMAGILIPGGLAIYYSVQSFKLLENSTNSAWWQWLLLALKPIGCLAIFTTFLVYAIRWFHAWAKQHADEELRNRTRLLDLGRAAWILEAVRDAQDHTQSLPPELLKDLSQNLFTQHVPTDGGELNPQGFSDLLMQRLATIRFKGSNIEVEASRKKEGE